MVRSRWVLFGLVLVLASCGGGGDDPAAPPAQKEVPIQPAAVDAQRYWPAEVGDAWRYEVRPDGLPPYAMTLETLRSKTEAGVTEISVEERTNNPAMPGARTNRFRIDQGGVVFLPPPSTATTAFDALARETGEYPEMQFPLGPSPFQAFDKTDLQVGDTDQDGKEDTVDRSMTTHFLGYEDVTVPAGTFMGAAKFERRLVQRFKLSRHDQLVDSVSVSTTWYAAGVGVVKAALTRTEGGQVSSAEQVLQAYKVGGASGGPQDALLLGLLDMSAWYPLQQGYVSHPSNIAAVISVWGGNWANQGAVGSETDPNREGWPAGQ